MSDPLLTVRSGQIDEIILYCQVLEIQRAGSAKYRFNLHGTADVFVEFELWTSRIGQIKIEAQESVPWLVWSQQVNGGINCMSAKNCLFHLEQMDRDVYCLSLSRAQDQVKITISTNGYLKTKVLKTTVRSS